MQSAIEGTVHGREGVASPLHQITLKHSPPQILLLPSLGTVQFQLAHAGYCIATKFGKLPQAWPLSCRGQRCMWSRKTMHVVTEAELCLSGWSRWKRHWLRAALCGMLHFPAS